ncbi:SHOCT domain-containing protein [Effusibacillus pohliae]|uniref:SHOCT domain-containing protein n=1 Tax=Effusibacillus pohliae TaxID=232270 RepID=UPI000365FE50|nr:SHOCT domain-containing protein [Effusibacillus pohliae]
MMHMMGWSMIFTMIVGVLIIGLVIYAFFSLIAKPFVNKEDSALRILQERFARGEISEDEYERRRAVLRRK